VDEARANLDKLRGVPDNCFAMAMLQLGLGEIDEAIAWFEKGMDKREPHMITVTFDPRLASLLPEPRFKPLLARMGL
jgi:hypothetical protein